MGVFNPADGSIHLKVVYYGPARGGKTTNLRQVRQQLDPDGESELLSFETGDDTTLFFDHLPLDLRLLGRHVVRVQAYTVPGQVRFDRTRRLVLKGCDGVVFVADSAPDKMEENRESWANLRENLRLNGLDPDKVPTVVQYNKRDLEDAASIDVLDRAIGTPDRVCHLACALDGDGVFEAFRDVLLEVMERAHGEFGLARYGLRTGAAVEALEEVLTNARRRPPASDRAPTHRLNVPVEGEPGPDALLEAAVRASVDLAELLGAVTSEKVAAERNARDLLDTTQGVVHDLRKPLVALTNAVWMLRRSEGKDEALAVADGAVSELTERLDECAARLRGVEAPPETVVDLEEIVPAVMRRLAPGARAVGVELRSRGRFPRVHGHAATLTSLVDNLVENAIKYRDPARDVGHVHLVARPQRDEGFALLVIDDGVGVPPEDRARVFEKHRRGSNVAGVEGTGLGLYLTKRIAVAHDARLGLRPARGGGTVVRVRFPACRVIRDAGDAKTPDRSRRSAPRPDVCV